MNPTTQPSIAGGASLHILPTALAASGKPGALVRNPGMKLDLGWLEEMRHVNRSALERRVASLTGGAPAQVPSRWKRA